MKVRRDREGLRFGSFDVTLTIESEEEARALYAIFNYTYNVDLLPRGVDGEVKKAIGCKYGDLGDSQYIAKGVYYRHFYRSKKED